MDFDSDGNTLTQSLPSASGPEPLPCGPGSQRVDVSRSIPAVPRKTRNAMTELFTIRSPLTHCAGNLDQIHVDVAWTSGSLPVVGLNSILGALEWRVARVIRFPKRWLQILFRGKGRNWAYGSIVRCFLVHVWAMGLWTPKELELIIIVTQVT